MRLALAPEVVQAEEAQVVDARVVGGVLGKRALGITESYQGFTHTLIIRGSEPSQLSSVWQETSDVLSPAVMPGLLFLVSFSCNSDKT